MHCAERLSNDFQRLFEAAAATLSGGGGVAGVDSFSPSLKKKKKAVNHHTSRGEYNICQFWGLFLKIIKRMASY